METQLLCTFCTSDELVDTCQNISEKYQVVSNKIFILENTKEAADIYSDDEQQLILTYNVTNADLNDVLNSTISVHRKKQTNTIYTINALNDLIRELNDGKLDKTFPIQWENYKNCLLLTNDEGLNKIPTRIYSIVDVKTWDKNKK